MSGPTYEDLRDLSDEEWDALIRGNFLYFFGSNSPFSNFHPSPFTISDNTYQTGETYYQAAKASESTQPHPPLLKSPSSPPGYFGDWGKRGRIIGAASPREAKMVSELGVGE